MEQKLSGPKFIKRLVRPPRIVFVVQSLMDVEKFISIASLSWGGRQFLAVPCNENQEINDEWFEVIRKYNPDQIKAFLALSSKTEEELWKSRYQVSKITEHTDTKIDVIYNPPNRRRAPEFFGQPILNIMLIDEFYNLDNGKAKLCYIPSDSPFSLYYRARYGVIENEEWQRWQDVYISESHRREHPSDLIQNAPIDIRQDLLSFIHQTWRREQPDEYVSLLDYGMTKLSQVYINRLFLDQQSKSETTNIIIVSKGENLEDFCWYWAIRGQRYYPYDIDTRGPIWIDQNTFVSKPELLDKLFRGRRNVFVISKSLSKDDLPVLKDGWSFQKEKLNEFYNEYYYVGDIADIPVNFIENETEYKFEAPESLKFLSPRDHQYVMVDIQVPGVTLPRIRGVSVGKALISNYQVSKSGLSQIKLSNSNEIANLVIPTAWDVVTTFADFAGFRSELSDKGRIGAELIRLIGGIENLWVISHPKIIDLFLEMSNVKKVNETRKIIYENIKDNEIKNKILNSLFRKSLSANNLSYSVIFTKLTEETDNEKIDHKLCNDIIEWLLEKDLLRQGKTIKCHTCYTDNWIAMNKFDTSIICSGCKNDIKIPFGINTIEWEYEINSLVSAVIDQGVLVHLLTGYKVFDGTNSIHHNKDIYGSYFGLDFLKAKTGDKSNKEVDVTFIVGGQLIVGECKVSGREFTAEILQNELDFAKNIGSRKVIFSCLDHFDDLENNFNDIKVDEIEVTLLGNKDLVCQFPGLSLDEELNKERKNRSPINKLRGYRGAFELMNDDHFFGFR